MYDKGQPQIIFTMLYSACYTFTVLRISIEKWICFGFQRSVEVLLV